MARVWLAAAVAAGAAVAPLHGARPLRSSTRDALDSDLSEVLQAQVELINVSLSLAVVYTNRSTGATEVIHTFGGPDNRGWDGSAGTNVTAESLYPVGSGAKPWVTVAALRLANPKLPMRPGGFLLDLDAPAVPIADKWLKDQGLPTITELWMADPGSNPENISVLVHNVSTRDLLSMQGGIYDYNDYALEQWTMDHPCAGPNATTPCDVAPTTYMTNMTHRLPDCPIGVDCAMYSGNSFVLAGFVLAAAQGAKTFEEFDVLGLVHDVLPPGTPRFNRTLFMGPGPCSAHPHVVHQYGTRPPAHHHDNTQVERGLGARFARSQGHLIAHESGHAPHTAAMSGWNPSGSEAHARAQCGWWSPIQQGMAAEGTVLAVKTLASAGDCCNFSTALGWPRGANLTWSYSSTNSTCQVFSAVTGRHADTATTIGQGGMPPTTEGCGTHPVHNHYRLTGGKILANRVNNGGWMSCCSLAAAFASQMGRAVSWTETLNPDRVQNSTCVVIESVGTSRWVVDHHSVSGQAGNIPLNRNQFYDLWNESCLNGWAMGNLAVAPADHARLFHLLFTGGLVSASDLKVMTRFKQLRHGWGVGLGYMGYGMGLMNFSGHLPGPGNLPQGWTRQFGHGGVDWGSGLYQMSGWFPDLNVSIVLATNALTSMNFTVGAPRLGMFESQWIPCNVLDTVAQHLSTFPKLNCSDVT